MPSSFTRPLTLTTTGVWLPETVNTTSSPILTFFLTSIDMNWYCFSVAKVLLTLTALYSFDFALNTTIEYSPAVSGVYVTLLSVTFWVTPSIVTAYTTSDIEDVIVISTGLPIVTVPISIL